MATINNWTDLNDVRNNLGTDYQLDADLDSETPGYDTHVGTPSDGWDPIGSIGTPYTGTFDGQGHTISDLICSGADRSALFNEVSGTMQDLLIDGCDILSTGASAGAAAVVVTGGTLSQVGTSGSVTSEDSDGSAGGLSAGHINSATATDCYSLVAVDGEGNAGGLTGSNSDSSYTRCYAAGAVTNPDSSTDSGGLVGEQANTDTYTDCYWDITATGQDEAVEGATPAGTTGLTTGEMTGTDARQNMSPFDYASVWEIVRWERETVDGYPILRVGTRSTQLDMQRFAFDGAPPTLTQWTLAKIKNEWPGAYPTDVDRIDRDDTKNIDEAIRVKDNHLRDGSFIVARTESINSEDTASTGTPESTASVQVAVGGLHNSEYGPIADDDEFRGLVEDTKTALRDNRRQISMPALPQTWAKQEPPAQSAIESGQYDDYYAEVFNVEFTGHY